MEHSPSDRQNTEPKTNQHTMEQSSGTRNTLSRLNDALKGVLFIGTILIFVSLLLILAALLTAKGAFHAPLLTALILLLLFCFLAYKIYNRYQREVTSWKMIAEENGLEYERLSTPPPSATLLFSVGRYRRVHHILRGIYESFPVMTFEYRYAVGYGRFIEGHSASVFLFKTEKTFPHCYLNNKNNHHFTVPPNAKQLPISEKFAKKFDLYVPPKYEIEALALFNDDTLDHIESEHWNHDVELVNNEIYVIHDSSHKVMFNAKLKNGAEFASYIQALPSASGFTPIRETPYTFGEIKNKLPIWSTDKYGSDRVFQYILSAFIAILSRLSK